MNIRWIRIILFGAGLASVAIYIWWNSRSVIYSNFGLIHSFDERCWTETRFSGQTAFATSFLLLGKPYRVESIEVAVCRLNDGGSSCVLSLFKDVDGEPGELLEASRVIPGLKLNDVNDDAGMRHTVPLSGQTVLQPKQRYWVVIREDQTTAMGWYSNAKGKTGKLLWRIDDAPWQQTPGPNVPELSMRIRGSPTP